MATLKTKDIIAKIDEFFESEFLPEEKSDWKRAMKKTATFDNISQRTFLECGRTTDTIITLNGKYNWRVYRDKKEEQENVFVIDDGEEVLLLSIGNPLIPINKVEFGINLKMPCFSEDVSVGFVFWVNEEDYSDESRISGESIGHGAIIGLEDEMFKLGYSVDYEAEGEGVFYKFKEGSTFEETKDPDNRISFTDVEVIKDILINRFGMTHDPELDEYIHVD